MLLNILIKTGIPKSMYTSITGWADGPISIDVFTHGFATEHDAADFGNGDGARYAKRLLHEIDAGEHSHLILVLSTGERIELTSTDATILREKNERSDPLILFPEEQEIVPIPLNLLATLTGTSSFGSMSFGVCQTDALGSYYDYLHRPIDEAEQERRKNLIPQVHEMTARLVRDGTLHGVVTSTESAG